jgi:hypothetical protein
VPILNKNIYIALQYKSQFANGIAVHGIGASRDFSIHPEAALMKAWQRVSMGD